MVGVEKRTVVKAAAIAAVAGIAVGLIGGLVISAVASAPRSQQVVR